MAIIRYYCSHCNHAFEAEQKENIECPSCFWTSSVSLESDHQEKQSLSQSHQDNSKKNFTVPTGLIIAFDALKPLLLLLLAVGLIAAGFIYLKPRLHEFSGGFKRGAIQLKLPNQTDSKKPAAEKKTGAKNKERSDLVPNSGTVLKPTLSEQENAVLARKIELDPARPLSPLEKEILSRQAVLKTGRVEKLPGPVWNLEQFKKMLADQQAAYQVPLPRSYRNKLEQLFESKYLVGSQAFTEGRILEARNSWVESLGFPVYANDIEKHRGVVLTMLRPFINDTLSKIGALNGMLVEGPVRDRETLLNQAYEQFQTVLVKQSWEEAYRNAQSLLKLTAEFDKTAVSEPQVPPYPPSSQMDRDIGKTLYDLLEASRPATADVGGLERDVRMKVQVIETLLPGLFEPSLQAYREGLKAMDAAEWQKAIDILSQVKEPVILQRDCTEKIKILQKIVRAELETGAISG